MIMNLGDIEFTKQKNSKKMKRTVFQVIILGIAIVLLAHLFINFRTYRPYDSNIAMSNKKNTGFIALSYFGVDRLGNTSDLIGKDRLQEHLQALQKQGYVTITQKDIENYYKNNTPLPSKALFLMFEDGRRDTAIFAQNILEKLNYKATMFTYPDKFDKKDTKFLTPQDLTNLQNSSFWEMGTNGYRLEYINVFDRYHNYIGDISSLEYSMMRPYLGRNYNHYLMDYIRDKEGFPTESHRQMVNRINYDYEHLRDTYIKQLGFVPSVYVLMHANTTQFGNNNEVSAVNEKWIRKLFTINFNREGYSLNQRNSSMYDLTRMQPKPYWPVNHLLMRIKYDVGQDISFVQGDEVRQEKWDLLKGASEIQGPILILTTLPEKNAIIKLKNSGTYQNLHVSVRLKGNELGTQQLLLRADKGMNTYISVALSDGYLVLTERRHNQKTDIFRKKMDDILGKKTLSIEEDQRNAEVQEYQTYAKYAPTAKQSASFKAQAEKRKNESAAGIDEGALPYEGHLNAGKLSNHLLHISLRDDNISVIVDGKEAVSNLPVSITEAGDVLLGAVWSKNDEGDDVYDAVFDNLKICMNTGMDEDKEKVLFSLELTGWEYMRYQLVMWWEQILGLFLEHL